jgi:mannose-6-phosphate isomerase-like protein (cupin superfamily)
MPYLSAFCLFVLLSGFTATAQVLPTSNGSCRVTASGLESCHWMSGGSLRRANSDKTTHSVDDDFSPLFVTRYILAPGAPLNPPIEGTEVLIVGMNNGELLNEKKSPQSHVNVFNGLVILMPKQEPYLLRNVGKQSLELLLIEVRN